MKINDLKKNTDSSYSIELQAQKPNQKQSAIPMYTVTHICSRFKFRTLTFGNVKQAMFASEEEAQKILDSEKRNLENILKPEEIATLEVKKVDVGFVTKILD